MPGSLPLHSSTRLSLSHADAGIQPFGGGHGLSSHKEKTSRKLLDAPRNCENVHGFVSFPFISASESPVHTPSSIMCCRFDHSEAPSQMGLVMCVCPCVSVCGKDAFSQSVPPWTLLCSKAQGQGGLEADWRTREKRNNACDVTREL